MRRLLVTAGALLALGAPAHAALPSGFVGLYGDDSFFGNSEYRADQMSIESRVGIQTVRQPFEWWRVERRPGRFDFSGYDSYMTDAARARLRVLPILMGPPQFRSSKPPQSVSRAMFPPKRVEDFAAFAGAAVRRYGENGSFWVAHPELPYVPIRSWQVWNEPNIPNFWRSGPNAKQYVALLRAGGDAIRAADPGAEVVAAGLPNSNLGVPFLEYLARMYKAGARGRFDTLAIHPYSPNVGGLMTLVERARDLMDSNGDHARLWITEFGWSTGGDASAFRVSRRGQANRIALALSGLVAERRSLRLRGFIFFKWKDSEAPPGMGGDPWPLHTGLLGADGFPKPGFWTFTALVHELANPAPATPGSAELAQVSRRNVRLSPRGFAGVIVGCGSERPGACAGTLRLRTAYPVACGGAFRRAGSQLGAAAFRVVVAPALVPVRLTAASRRLTNCVGAMRVRASVAKPAAAHAARAQPVEFVIRARR